MLIVAFKYVKLSKYINKSGSKQKQLAVKIKVCPCQEDILAVGMYLTGHCHRGEVAVVLRVSVQTICQDQ